MKIIPVYLPPSDESDGCFILNPSGLVYKAVEFIQRLTLYNNENNPGLSPTIRWIGRLFYSKTLRVLCNKPLNSFNGLCYSVIKIISIFACHPINRTAVLF